MKLLVPAAFGLEAAVKRQLGTLGYGKAPAQNGRISLEGDWQDIARLNVCLRSGERVLLELASFPADTFDDLFQGVSEIPWEDFISSHGRILMEGKCVKSKLGAIKACGGIIKKAIVNRLSDKYGLNTLPEDGERYIINFSIYEDAVSVCLDTSGEGLHKRGYRDLAYTAPLKETLASGILDMTYYFPDKEFSDPFCGSGTFPIEAALKALNIAPGINRSFDFVSWPCAPKGVEYKAKEEARDNEKRDREVHIYGSDTDKNAISIAKHHAVRAGVDKYITFSVTDARDIKSKTPRGVLVCNPPYGERMGDESEVAVLYRDFGKAFRSLPDWNAYILTSFKDFERNFGRRADRKKPLKNAELDCMLYSYLSSKPQKEGK